MPWTYHPNAWSDEELRKLIEWRAEGLSSIEIGQRLGRSQGAIKAKVKALDLPRSRYEPTPPHERLNRAGPAPKPERVQRVGKVSLPPLPSLAER